CDSRGTYLTHDSPSVRKTHRSGRKHKENVKGYQSQSLIDKTTAACHQGKMPTPFSASPAGAMIPTPTSLLGPPHYGMMPAPHMQCPPMMSKMGPPPPGRTPLVPAPGMRPPIQGHAHLVMVSTQPGIPQLAN
ncbi:RU1C protein, partial [Crocuta crocuta]